MKRIGIFLIKARGTIEYLKRLSGAKLKESKGLSVLACLIMLSASTALAAPDISAEKTASPDPVTAGNNLTYTIIVENAGPDTATGVILEDNLPAGVSFVSADASKGACGELGGTVTCFLGNFLSGASETVNIVVTAPNIAGIITNTVTVAENETDLDNSDNIDTIQTTVNTAPLCAVEVIYGEKSGEVEILKSLRNEILSKIPEGQEIIRLYYHWSPAIVEEMEKDQVFKKEVKEMIDGVLLLVEEEVE